VKSQYREVDEAVDFIGKWSVNYYGADKFCIEETDGPGHAKLVRVYADCAEAYAAAAKHNLTAKKV